MISNAETIFWDFDGVIKDSLDVKSDAFEKLFLPFGKEIAENVRKHHEMNGGMSRFDKLPIYLNWAGCVSIKLVDQYSDKFSILVKQKVITSKWVSGVLAYLQNNYKRQQFFIITATPQLEIEEILSSLHIEHYFQEVIGYPTTKKNAIRLLLNNYNINVNQAIMIGDAANDYYASAANKLPFVLRRTHHNKELQQNLDCKMIDDFLV